MLNIIFELGQIVFMGALVYGAFFCIKECESFREAKECESFRKAFGCIPGSQD